MAKKVPPAKGQKPKRAAKAAKDEKPAPLESAASPGSNVSDATYVEFCRKAQRAKAEVDKAKTARADGWNKAQADIAEEMGTKAQH